MAERPLRGDTIRIEFAPLEPQLRSCIRVETDSRKGREVSTDGDLITDIAQGAWKDIPRSPETRVLVDEEHETIGLFGSDHQQPAMTLIAIADGQEPLKLHLV